MAGSIQEIGFNEGQKIAANLIASTLCSGGTEALLDAQADLLKNVQTAMTGWLHRRQEAIADAHRLVTRMRESRDVTEIWKAQQEWAAGALQRFAADATVYPALFATAGRRATEATRESIAPAAEPPRQAVVEVARRAVEPFPKPPAGRPGKAVSTEVAKPPAEAKPPAAEGAPAH